ncbi:MAG: ATP-dependent DNA helicase RecQ [Flavobacteriales bacterium]
MNNPTDILKQFWGFDSFRPLQDDIVNSVLDGKDTLALLPTGGGKSVCFQVPAMCKPGLCLVVSPLIALMRDQVDNLKKRGVNAACIVSGMSYREIDHLLDHAVYGNLKFLYVSPERLTTDIFKERVKKMNINLLAIDEAHCISQWGYDFRPPYLEIAGVKTLFKQPVPTLALTATATLQVVDDIQEKLGFKEKNVFQKSFRRDNLAYVVQQEEDKLTRLIKIANRIKGSAVVYVRNRKKTKQIATFLQSKGISADYYNAGLNARERANKQADWINDKIRIIVATNAFGMGIDKPDVRFVVHLDLPDSPETYFQEAGRGGRDEKKAFGILLVNNTDREELLKNFERSFPEVDEIKRIYSALHSYFNIAFGSGKDETFSLRIDEFAKRYNTGVIEVYSALKAIDICGYISLSEGFHSPPKFRFICDYKTLYDYQLKDKLTDQFTKLLLRSYTGLFDEYVKIDELVLSKRMGISVNDVKKMLLLLHKLELGDYQPSSDLPTVTLLQDRLQDKYFTPGKIYHQRKQRAKERVEAMINYAFGTDECRSITLVQFFGEQDAKPCGQCDICIEKKRKEENSRLLYSIQQDVLNLLTEEEKAIYQIKSQLTQYKEENLKQAISWLIDNKKIEPTEHEKYRIK